MSAQPASRFKPISIDAPAPVRSMRIEWGISRRALGDHAPRGNAALITLRFETDQHGHGMWSLIDAQSNAQTTLPPTAQPASAACGILQAGTCIHIECDSLYAFVSIERSGEPELLYARTDVFERLGIPGGRYQPLGARVVLDPSRR